MADPLTNEKLEAQGISEMPVSARPPRLRSSLIGRESELAQIGRMLEAGDVSLLTLTGPGGVGKTRLVIEAGIRAEPRFPDGVVYVALDSTPSHELVCKTIGDSLGLGISGSASALEQDIAYLRHKQLLLVLDNFEHVLDAGSNIVRLLQECEGVKVLVTSRSRLRLSLEHHLPVQPLSIPASVELFVTRARALNPSFALDAGSASDIAAICARLDGLPLAVELAAARVPMFSPASLRARLEPALDLLTTGARDQPDRHRTMRNAIAWSYDLLEPAEQQLLRQLSIFEQSFSLDLAETVTGDPALLDGLLTLIDTNLVHVSGDPSAAEPRYRLMHTVREFGLELLAERGELQMIQLRHATAVRDLVASRSEWIWTGEGKQIVQRFDQELGNIRAALRWSAEAGEWDIEVTLAGALLYYWIIRGHLAEGCTVMQKAIFHAGPDDIPELARLYTGINWIATLQGNYDVAREAGLRGLEVAKRHRHVLYEAQALQMLARVEMHRGETAAALAWAEQSLILYRQYETEFESGAQHVSSVLSTMGAIALATGDPDRASTFLEEQLRRQRDYGSWWLIGQTLRHLGDAAWMQGDRATALDRYRESISIAHEHGNRNVLAGSLVSIAMLESDRGNVVRATRLLAGAGELSTQAGFALDSWVRARYETVLAHLRRTLDANAFRASWDAGAAISLDDLLSDALDDSAAPPPVMRTLDGPEQLTPRERSVLALLAEGRSDREIGEALSISPRTASGHVANLLAKLDLPSRTAAAAYAIRNDLRNTP